jgi:CRISPR-associated protein Cmr3
MVKQTIFIEPNDVWLFRDNKPFSAGSNFTARSQFPPNPQVTQGVVRSYSYFNGKMIGDSKNMGGLSLQGPFVAKRAGKQYERYFSTPLDLLYAPPTRDKEKGYFATLKVQGQPTYKSNAPDGWRPLTKSANDDFDVLKEATGWLNEAQLMEYLNGKLSTGKITASSEIYQDEERTGLALDYSKKTNKESMLYSTQFVRLQPNFGLVMEMNYTDKIFQSSGMIRIGGESRSGRYEEIPDKPSFVLKKEGNLKVVLLTPAYFSAGWQPTDWSTWLGKDARWVSGVFGKAQAISGWDLVINRPKPLRHFVPAGSVYYFENAKWQDKPFTENPSDTPFAEMGFGTVAVTSW